MAARDPMTAVFGNDQAPHDLYNRSRAEHAASAVGLQPLKTDYLCPVGECGQRIMIYPGKPGFTCQGNSNHHWNDIQELRALNPKQVAVEQTQRRQPGHVDVTIQIPKDLLDQLNQRFGQKLAATLAAVLRNIADPETLMINSSDKTQIEVWLGAKVGNSAQLKGMVYAQFQAKQQIQLELTALRTAVQELDERPKLYVNNRFNEMMKG